MPAVNAVYDNPVFPALVIVGVFGIFFRVGRGVFDFNRQYIVLFKQMPYLEIRASKHSSMLA